MFLYQVQAQFEHRVACSAFRVPSSMKALGTFNNQAAAVKFCAELNAKMDSGEGPFHQLMCRDLTGEDPSVSIIVVTLVK